MEIITIPDFLLGANKDEVNIFFYLREKGPDQIKLKLSYSQNMLCFMIRGVKELIDENERYTLDDEQIGLVRAGHMLMTERVTLRQEFESLLMFFSHAFIADFLTRYQITVREPEEDFPSVLAFPKDDYLINFQSSMKMLEKDFSKRAFRQAKMEEILLYLLEKYPARTNRFIAGSIATAHNNPLRQVVQNHKFKNLTSEELAFLCNMSLSTFKRRFRDVYKMSPRKYVVSERMKRAAQLLRHRKRPSEFYFDLGYENLSSFSNEFKKHFGMPPTAYSMQG